MNTYEKKYKEAAKWMESIYPTLSHEQQMEAESFFPELKESEDEKVEMAIFGMVYDSDDELWSSYDVSKSDILAWLEKQGEQKSAELSNSCEFSIKTWINIVAYVLKEHNGIGNYLDDPEVKDTAEKLQKRYKFDSASEEWDRVYRKGLDAGVNKGKAIALREKNHAWSKEDEIHFSWLIEHLGQSAGLYDNLIDWLKSIKDRVIQQPKQEWSEEDEDMIQTIDSILFKNGLDKARVWLKSLRPQKQWKDSLNTADLENELCWLQDGYSNTSHEYKVLGEAIEFIRSTEPQKQWKPSEEQMKALKEACDEHWEPDGLDPLYTLWKQLKKLKE